MWAFVVGVLILAVVCAVVEVVNKGRTVLPILARFFDALSHWSSRMCERCSFCPECGRNLYTGAPCVDFQKKEA